MTGRQNRETDNNQLWRVAYPSGAAARLTDDFNAPDGKFIAAGIRPASDKEYSLAVFSIDGAAPRLERRFKPLDGAEFPNWLRWSPDGTCRCSRG